MAELYILVCNLSAGHIDVHGLQRVRPCKRPTLVRVLMSGLCVGEGNPDDLITYLRSNRPIAKHEGSARLAYARLGERTIVQSDRGPSLPLMAVTLV